MLWPCVLAKVIKKFCVDSDGEMLRVWEQMSIKYAQDPRKDRYHEYIATALLCSTNDEDFYLQRSDTGILIFVNMAVFIWFQYRKFNNFPDLIR